MIWVIKEQNDTVTDYYFNILKRAAEIAVNTDVKIVYKIDENKSSPATDIIILGSITKAITYFFKGYKNIIVWFQGISPEESYMRNNSIVRKKVLEFIEKKVLLRTRLAIFVSHAMKDYYEEKYQIDFKNRYYIMPCYNTQISRDAFLKTDKYKNNIFAYTGGLSPWQGFDRILACYENIEKMGLPNTKLLVLTPEQEKALEEIKKTSIKNFEIGYVQVEELPQILAYAKFGFIIREDNVVNRVSTPTKLSTYTANGLIPIYSECISDFHFATKDFKYKLCIDSHNFYDRLQYLMQTKIDAESVHDEYSILFSSYYNDDYHCESVASLLKSIFKY